MAAAASAAPGWSWVGRQRAMGSSGGSVGRCGIVCRGDGMAALRYPWLLPAVWWSHLLPNMEQWHASPQAIGMFGPWRDHRRHCGVPSVQPCIGCENAMP